jgi:hypothetical protein
MNKEALDDLGVAIADAGYTWTPEMRSAYEKGVRKEWVGLTDEDLKPLCDEWKIMYGWYVNDFARAIEAKLKEKNT